jgi:hypothetical protein
VSIARRLPRISSRGRGGAALRSTAAKALLHRALGKDCPPEGEQHDRRRRSRRLRRRTLFYDELDDESGAIEPLVTHGVEGSAIRGAHQVRRKNSPESRRSMSPSTQLGIGWTSSLRSPWLRYNTKNVRLTAVAIQFASLSGSGNGDK